jgi:hypothetical protein
VGSATGDAHAGREPDQVGVADRIACGYASAYGRRPRQPCTSDDRFPTINKRAVCPSFDIAKAASNLDGRLNRFGKASFGYAACMYSLTSLRRIFLCRNPPRVERH